jgi:hypothetical protein
MSREELLKAVEQLQPPDLDRFVSEVIALRAHRQTQGLTPSETELLLKINQGLPPELRQKWDELMHKREAEKLTHQEYQELLRLTDQVEALQANRVKFMVELAQIRKKSLSELMQELGLRAPANG